MIASTTVVKQNEFWPLWWRTPLIHLGDRGRRIFEFRVSLVYN